MAHILLVEPNQVLGRQYSDYLTQVGHQVVWAKNAQDAILKADAVKPDIVLLELLLQAHSGVEFLHEFRSYAEWQEIPVIVLSRLPRSEVAINQKTATMLGIISYLYKPETSLERLGTQIARALQPVQA